MAEHQAVLDLVPLNAVDREVVQSGSWSNAATWSGGELPKSGENLYVPEGKSLSVDIVSDLSLGNVRVDGIMKFATNKNIKIKLDTLIVTQTGTFEIGSEQARVPSSKKIEIIIAQHGPIDRDWDPTNISRGVILQGKTRIYGAEKSAYQLISTDPAVGSTQIQLASVPTGWIKGDIIAITATKFRAKKSTDASYQTEDELRRIKSISGTTITLGSVTDSNKLNPLSYSHVPVIENMPIYAANLTRNVVFSGEGGDLIPVNQRGHFVVMHTPDVVIKGAGFYHLGRTNKSIPIDDFQLDSAGYRITDASGQYVPGSNTNSRGRYAVHFHHTGVDIDIPPVICSGNAVFSSPGWGFVNHTSNVIMANNASYDVYGSHFVTEDGNELGAFKNNIAIKSEGGNRSEKVGAYNHDGGHTGHGFWLESRNMIVEDNIASGVYRAGLIYFQRMYIKGIDTLIPEENLLTADKGILKGLPKIGSAHIPITHDKNTTVLSSGAALTVIKANANQQHDGRSIIESLKGYSVLSGVDISYSEKYTLKDLELVADPSTSLKYTGFNVSIKVSDIVIINGKINGFRHPIVTGTTTAGTTTDGVFVNVLVDGHPVNPNTDIHQPIQKIVSNYDPDFHQIMNSLPNNTDELNFIPSDDMSYDFPQRVQTGFLISGTKTDSLGKIEFTSRWYDGSLRAIAKKGYYTHPDGSKFVILADLISDRVTGETKTFNTRLNIIYKYDFSFMGPHLGQLPD
jgi:G8 domain